MCLAELLMLVWRGRLLFHSYRWIKEKLNVLDSV